MPAAHHRQPPEGLRAAAPSARAGGGRAELRGLPAGRFACPLPRPRPGQSGGGGWGAYWDVQPFMGFASAALRKERGEKELPPNGFPPGEEVRAKSSASQTRPPGEINYILLLEKPEHCTPQKIELAL